MIRAASFSVTWVLLSLFQPLLPAEHPLKGERKPLLRDWIQHSTNLNVAIGVCALFYLAALLVLLVSLALRGAM